MSAHWILSCWPFVSKEAGEPSQLGELVHLLIKSTLAALLQGVSMYHSMNCDEVTLFDFLDKDSEEK